MDNGPTPLESGQARVLHSFSSEPPLETWRSCIAVAKHKEKTQHKILTRVSHHRCSAANSSGHIACHLQDVAVHGSLQSYCSSFVLGIMHHAQPPQGKPHPCRLAHFLPVSRPPQSATAQERLLDSCAKVLEGAGDLVSRL